MALAVIFILDIAVLSHDRFLLYSVEFDILLPAREKGRGCEDQAGLVARIALGLDYSYQKGGNEMTKDIKIRWDWLKFMYIYTIIGNLIAIPFPYVFAKEIHQ